MFTLKVENTRHEVLRLTQNENEYQVLKVEGVDPPKATISSHAVAGMDGSKVTSTKLEERNLVLTIKVKGDIERNRQNLYNFFRTKEICKVYFKNQNRDVYIEGYVDDAPVDIFSNKETMQVSIVCNNPYFKGLQEIVKVISVWIDNFKFPFSIGASGIPFSYLDSVRNTSVINNSDSETGVEIIADFRANASKFIINNVVTEEHMTFEYAFLEHDKLTINTNKGYKRVILERNNTKINLIGSMKRGSKFFILSAGENLFNYEVDNNTDFNGNLQITIKFSNLYRGL